MSWEPLLKNGKVLALCLQASSKWGKCSDSPFCLTGIFPATLSTAFILCFLEFIVVSTPSPPPSKPGAAASPTRVSSNPICRDTMRAHTRIPVSSSAWCACIVPPGPGTADSPTRVPSHLICQDTMRTLSQDTMRPHKRIPVSSSTWCTCFMAAGPGTAASPTRVPSHPICQDITRKNRRIRASSNIWYAVNRFCFRLWDVPFECLLLAQRCLLFPIQRAAHMNLIGPLQERPVTDLRCDLFVQHKM